MKVFHLSVECYPAAKVGGLADVVGALPKYQRKLGLDASVVMPWYNKPFFYENSFEVVFEGIIHQFFQDYPYKVYRETTGFLGYDLYLIKIDRLIDRDNVYGYWDESQQFLAFQHSVLNWLSFTKNRPDVLHCHDYHTGLVPFMVENCFEFEFLKGVKTLGTIHNGEYQGDMSWQMASFLPQFDSWKWGLLDWNGRINPLATMIKCCHAFTTVSNGYLEELYHEAKGLESIISRESGKSYGIINGIDTEVWNPETDPMVECHFNTENVNTVKFKNKEQICEAFQLNKDLPLFAFIGRFAGEKGADLLPEIITRSIQETNGALNIIVLGSGNPQIEQQLWELKRTFNINFALDFGYNEPLSHRIYASADFLLMPSRVEPCGLNQMYAMRYGTIPIVRYTGGLKDTVIDISSGGYGFNYTYPGADDAVHAIKRALHVYGDQDYIQTLRKTLMSLDFSWENSARKYEELYKN